MENSEIKGLKVAELRALAKEKGIEAPEKLKKAELIEALTKQDINADIREESTVRDIGSSDKKIINSRVENKDRSENKEDRPEVEGILEIVDGGFGFLRFDNFLTSEKDIYVSPTQIRRFNLKTGDKILGISRKPNDGERFGALLFVKSVNGDSPQEAMKRKDFDLLTPLFPFERISLENERKAVYSRDGRIFQ